MTGKGMIFMEVAKNLGTNGLSSIKRRRAISKTIVYILLISLSIVFLFPLIWMIFSSVKPENEIMLWPPKILPTKWDWMNYKEIFEIQPFARYYFNSLFVTIFNVIGTVFSSAFVAFGFARIRGKGRDVWFAILLATMMLPSQVTMIPVYMIWSRLGFVNTFWPLILPAYFGNAYYIFLLRQFFKTIPKELEDAAYIDGCSTFGFFWKIMLPLSKPALITVAILSFMGVWNDFLNPLIYLHDTSKYTLALGLLQFKGALIIEWGPMMGASLLSIIPVILLFFFGQKYFVQGIATTGVKG